MGIYHYFKQLYYIWQLSKIHSLLWLKPIITKNDLFFSIKKLANIKPYMDVFINNQLFKIFYNLNLAKLSYLTNEIEAVFKLTDNMRNSILDLPADLKSLNITKNIKYFISLLTIQATNNKLIKVMEENNQADEVINSANNLTNQINIMLEAANKDTFLQNNKNNILIYYLLAEKFKIDFYLHGGIQINQEFINFVKRFDDKQSFINFITSNNFPKELNFNDNQKKFNDFILNMKQN